jgi:hypothetical protein
MYDLDQITLQNGSKLFKFNIWDWVVNQFKVSRIAQYESMELFFIVPFATPFSQQFHDAYIEDFKFNEAHKNRALIVNVYDKRLRLVCHTGTAALYMQSLWQHDQVDREYIVNIKIGYYKYSGKLADLFQHNVEWICRKLTILNKELGEIDHSGD